jgi:hypothetical protein
VGPIAGHGGGHSDAQASAAVGDYPGWLDDAAARALGAHLEQAIPHGVGLGTAIPERSIRLA